MSMSLLSMGDNEANLRAAEENWLDPDYVCEDCAEEIVDAWKRRFGKA